MSKYLLIGSYTIEGLNGLLKDGGSRRRQDLENSIKILGGSLEAMYYAFGPDDVICIVDMPDHVKTATLSLVVTASGAAKVKTVVLLTPEEIDQAARVKIDYRPPGQ